MFVTFFCPPTIKCSFNISFLHLGWFLQLKTTHNGNCIHQPWHSKYYCAPLTFSTTHMYLCTMTPLHHLLKCCSWYQNTLALVCIPCLRMQIKKKNYIRYNIILESYQTVFMSFRHFSLHGKQVNYFIAWIAKPYPTKLYVLLTIFSHYFSAFDLNYLSCNGMSTFSVLNYKWSKSFPLKEHQPFQISKYSSLLASHQRIYIFFFHQHQILVQLPTLCGPLIPCIADNLKINFSV